MSTQSQALPRAALTSALERLVRGEPLDDVLRGSAIGTAGGLALADTLRSSAADSLDLYGCGL